MYALFMLSFIMNLCRVLGERNTKKKGNEKEKMQKLYLKMVVGKLELKSGDGGRKT